MQALEQTQYGRRRMNIIAIDSRSFNVFHHLSTCVRFVVDFVTPSKYLFTMFESFSYLYFTMELFFKIAYNFNMQNYKIISLKLYKVL